MTEMSFVYYKDITTGVENTSIDIALEKGVEYVDPGTGISYYLYSSGFATVIKLPVEFTERSGTPKYVVSEGSVITVPESVSNDNKVYEVKFVGSVLSTYGGTVIKAPVGQTNKNIFCGANSNTLTINFKGNVILNYQPFTAPFNNTNAGSATSSVYNYDLVFDGDVEVNSYPVSTSGGFKLYPCSKTLTAVQKITIGGVFKGAIVSEGTATQNPELSNSNIALITFDPDFNPDMLKSGTMQKTTIISMGLMTGSTLTVEPAENGYCIKNKAGTVVCGSVGNVTNNPDELKTVADPITLRVVNGDSVTYSLVTKGQTKVLENPVAPEGKEFVGWYKDSRYTEEYDSNELLNANTTVYAKYVPKQYTTTIFGDGITVKNGDNVVADGSKIAFETGLTLVLEERVGYRAIVKMDGAVVSGTTVNVPAKDFTISCEWVSIPYTVKCMDGETVVKTVDNCHLGDVISLPAVKKDGFTGWSVENGMLLGAQYIVNYRDVGANDTIVLSASFSEIEDTVWSLTVTGTDVEGKAFWTKSNAIGSYGIVTVIPGEFEKATVAIEPAVVGAYVGKLSDSTYMVYSANGEDVTVTVSFQSVGKASEYAVSLVEIAKEGAPGFRATVTATDGGVIDTTGTLSMRYVYKVKDATSGLWCYTTSGPSGTEGVPDRTFDLSNMGNAYAVSKDFFLSDVENADGAYLVYGYASYSFKDTSAGSEATVIVASPVIMSVSEIQAVVSRT